MLPRVVIHNAVSADGRLDFLQPDPGLYREIAGRFRHDAILTTANTLLAEPRDIPAEDRSAFRPRAVDPNDSRPLLVVADGRGRLRDWHYWCNQPQWRDAVALVSGATPARHLRYLELRHVEYIRAGAGPIDLWAALSELSARFGVKQVRVDAGGTLNGALLRAGLVHEVSLLVQPCLVGGTSPQTLFRAADLDSAEGVVKLRPAHVEELKGGVVWLRYRVVRAGKA